MGLKIAHGIFRNYTGSSTIFSNSELVTTTVFGPSDSSRRDGDFTGLTVETKVKHFPHSKPFENMAAGIVNRLLDMFVVKEAEKFRSMVVTSYTNTFSLSMLCNSVLVACLDAGVPLKAMFYCVGVNDLFVFSGGDIVAHHSFGFVDEKRSGELQRELKYVKEECIDLAMADVFAIE